MSDSHEIPAGKALLLPGDVYILRGGDDPAGVLVNSEGRLAISAASVGLGVHLSAADAAALSVTLARLAETLARRERAAASDADAVLRRVRTGAVQ